jgi:hypothetical protein
MAAEDNFYTTWKHFSLSLATIFLPAHSDLYSKIFFFSNYPEKNFNIKRPQEQSPKNTFQKNLRFFNALTIKDKRQKVAMKKNVQLLFNLSINLPSSMDC